MVPCILLRKGKKQIMPKMPLKRIVMIGLATLVICIIAALIGSEWIVGYVILFLLVVISSLCRNARRIRLEL